MLGRQENFLEIVDALSREKGVEKDIVLKALCLGIEKAAQDSYGQEQDICASIDEKTGNISLVRRLEVVEMVETPRQIVLKNAREKDPKIVLGEFIQEPLPSINRSRVWSQLARHVIMRTIQDASCERQYELYKDRVGEMISGIVKRIEFGHSVVVELNNAEGVLRREEMLPKEVIVQGRRINSYIYEVERSNRAPQILLSRTRPDFMNLLFHLEVPEVTDNVVEIKGISRDPGSRAKISVVSHDPSVDPVGACVGMRGNRVQAVVSELGGERIDIVPWSDEISDFIANALAPARITKVLIDRKKHKVIAVAPKDQLSLAIGRRGQNVRLASQLTGWHIDIMTEEDERAKSKENHEKAVAHVMEALDVEDVLAQMLVASNFSHVDDIAQSSLSALGSLDGFDEGLAQELQKRAQIWVEKQESVVMENLNNLKVDPKIRTIDGMTDECLMILIKKGVRTLEDLAEYSAEDLVGGWEEAPIRRGYRAQKIPGMLDNILTEKGANIMILKARALVGWISEKDRDQAIVALEQEPESESPEETDQEPSQEEPTKA